MSVFALILRFLKRKDLNELTFYPNNKETKEIEESPDQTKHETELALSNIQFSILDIEELLETSNLLKIRSKAIIIKTSAELAHLRANKKELRLISQCASQIIILVADLESNAISETKFKTEVNRQIKSIKILRKTCIVAGL